MRRLNSRAVLLFFFPRFLTTIMLMSGFVFFLWFYNNSEFVETDTFIAIFNADFPETAFLTVAASSLITLVWACLHHHFYRYQLCEDSFRKESGIIAKKYVAIPYSKIQNVDIYRGLFARILGLSTLSIQTAAGSESAEAFLPGVSRRVAEKLRDDLVRNL